MVKYINYTDDLGSNVSVLILGEGRGKKYKLNSVRIFPRVKLGKGKPINLVNSFFYADDDFDPKYSSKIREEVAKVANKKTPVHGLVKKIEKIMGKYNE